MNKLKFLNKLGWVVSALLIAIAVGFVVYVLYRMHGVDFQEF